MPTFIIERCSVATGSQLDATGPQPTRDVLLPPAGPVPTPRSTS